MEVIMDATTILLDRELRSHDTSEVAVSEFAVKIWGLKKSETHGNFAFEWMLDRSFAPKLFSSNQRP